MPEPRYSYVRIGLPLSIDVFATIGSLLEKAWPGAQIITDPAAAGVPRDQWPRSGEQLIRVDTTRRPKPVSKRVAAAAVAENAPAADDDPMLTNGIDKDGWVSMSTPEELQHTLGAICHRILEESEGAINYLEWELVDRESGTRTVVSAARSKGQTPHKLRMKAEAERDELREALRELLAMYPGGCDGLGCGGWDDLVTKFKALAADGA